MSKHYVVIWVEVEDDLVAEDVEEYAVHAVERVVGGRLVQNRIQDVQP